MKIFNHQSGQYANIDKAKIYFETIGDIEKPILLMLHGGFGTIEDLNSIVSYLSNEFYIIGIDSRGHGKSTLGDKKLTYQQIQFDVESILKDLGIDTVNIIGFSDGGVVGYRIASSSNIKVNKLITMGASWREEDIVEVEDMLKTITPQSAKEIFHDNFELYQKLNPESDFDKLTKANVDMWLDKSQTGHPNKNVKNISAKTLLIRGDNDFLVSLESLSQLKNEINDSSFLNVSFSEHEVDKEQPQIIEIMIKVFLEILKDENAKT